MKFNIGVSLKFVNTFHFWWKSDTCNGHCARFSVHFCIYVWNITSWTLGTVKNV